MVKIGLVDIDVSHPQAFAGKMEELSIPMGYTHICNYGFREKDEVEAFAAACGAKVVDAIEDMVDEVDVGFVQGCNWDKHLPYAMPFINAGKPVFIDKPLVGSVADVKKVRALAEGGARIYGSSSMRYAQEILDFLAMPVEERGEILNVFSSVGVDEFNYAIHAVEIVCAVAGAKAVSCRFAGKSAKIDGCYTETFVVEFENGVSGTYVTTDGIWLPFGVSIVTSKNSYSFPLDALAAFGTMLSNIEAAVSSRENVLATMDTVTDSTLIMLAGKLSRERGGEVVKLSELPEDLSFDGAEFERGYAARASKIYL